MKFDAAKTLKLVKGGLFGQEATWREYLEENNSWQQTVVVLTGPLVIVSFLCQLIFSRLMGGWSMYGYPGANFFMALILGLVMAALGVAILTAAFWFLAGQMKGRKDFDRAFAAVSLALIPSYIAGVIAALIPWLGWLIGFAGFVVSLVFLWKIMPMALAVPEEKRTLHYILSLLVSFIINAFLSFFIVGSMIGDAVMSGDMGDFSTRSDRDNGTPGMFSELERQGKLVEAAQSDRFDPPSDGKLDEDQVEELLAVLQKTKAARERYTERMQKVTEEMENKETPSFGDIANVYSNIGSATSAVNAEMEVVKTGGGNWAEHQWVKNQLRVAIIQQGQGSEAIEHNFELYEEYEEELDEWF